mgnify:CR=1 FL=1
MAVKIKKIVEKLDFKEFELYQIKGNRQELRRVKMLLNKYQCPYFQQDNSIELIQDNNMYDIRYLIQAIKEV